MAAADISGPGGNITIAGYSFHLSAWSATIETEDVETTGFAEAGNRTFAATTNMINFGAVGTGQSGATMLPTSILGTTPTMASYIGAVVLTAASGNTFSFNGLLKTIAFNRAENGKLDVVVSGKSTGPITVAWA